MKETLLTFVVPIYNVEKYIEECLSSFVKQKDKRFIVYLIDDGSTDTSGEIAKKYEKEHPDIFRYIYQDNKGLGGARNTGLALVETPYIMFLDSDDYLGEDLVSNFYNYLDSNINQSDVIFFNPLIYDMEENKFFEWHDKELINNIFSKENPIKVKDNPVLYELEANVCRAIYKTSLLKENKITFIEHCYWEDVPFHFALLNAAETAYFLSYEGGFIYRTGRKGQITKQNGLAKLDMEKIFNMILPYFKSKGYTKIEKAYMLSFLSKYMFWHLHTVDDEYRKRFVDISHDFFKKITLGQYLCFFFKTKMVLRNKIMIWYLKSSLHYKVYYDLNKVNRRMKIFHFFKRK